MIYVGLNAKLEVEAVTEKLEETHTRTDLIWQSRWEWPTKAIVDYLADQITEYADELFIGIDNGASVSPRFDIIRAPKVGDEVSMGFNGDYYPQGKIKAISASLKVITLDNGKRFYRRHETARWVYKKTWTLIQGVKDERNPHL